MSAFTRETKERLHSILASLYPDFEAAFDLSRRAGLSSADLSNLPHTRSRRWPVLLQMLEQKQLLESAITLAALDYPRNAGLKQLIQELGISQLPASPEAPVPGRVPSRPVRVFISYSHEDEAFLHELETHLTLLRRSGEIEFWHDQMISAGEQWLDAVHLALASADVFLALISPAYLASDFSYAQLEQVIRHSLDGHWRVVPIIIRPTNVDGLPLAKLQVLPRNAKAMSQWKSRDEAWVDVVQGLRNLFAYAIHPAPSGSTALPQPRVLQSPPRKIVPIGDIFRCGRQPDITFVEPAQLQALKVHFRTMGQGLVIEGPSGIGKTTAAHKAREAVAPKQEHRRIQSLRDVAELRKALAEGFTGHLIVDDFHHLDEDTKRGVANAIKVLADDNREDAKLTVIGINPVGMTLMKNFPDLAGRYEVVSMGRQPDDRIATLIRKGEEAAQVAFLRRDEFINAAAGSFFTAQQLCFQACIAEGIEETQPAPRTIALGVNEVLDKVMASLDGKYRQPLRDFSAYDKAQDQAGACLALLWLLSRDPEGFVSAEEASLQFPMLEGSFAWLRNGALQEAFTHIPALARLLYFNPRASVLSLEDPQLAFYLRYLPWLDFARKSGHTRVKLDAGGELLFPQKPRVSAAPPHQPSAPEAAPNPIGPEVPGSLVLHLSDLHFGTEDQATLWYEQLAQDLRELKCEALDVVILSGDITNRSSEEEYAAARLFLRKLLTEFEISPRQLVLVPGNHDLSWDLSKKAYLLHRREDFKGKLEEGFYIDRGSIVEVREEGAYRLRFEPFSKFYEELKGPKYPLEYASQAILQHFPEQKLLVLGLNSAWEIDHAHKGRASIHSGALSNALATLRTAPEYADTLKIAVWHHPIAGEGDDRIRDSGFLEQLAKAGFRLALHGHIHAAKNNLFRYDMTVDGRRIDLVSAGTFGAPMKEWVPGHPLGYNALRINGERVVIETRRREELNGTWKPDARWLQGPGRDPLPRYEIRL